MARKCPKGVICFENMTLLFVVIFVIGAIYLFGRLAKNNNNLTINELPYNNFLVKPNNSFTNTPNDVLLNPYTPPLKNDRYIIGSGDPRGIPINVQTQGVDAEYRQTGILTRLNGPETILPLMGRPLITNRDKWQFYTISDKNNGIKLPVSNNGRSCTNEYGCDNLYNGDTVYIEGYNDAFKVTNYDNNTMKYIPFI